MSGENVVHIVSVEVESSDEALQVKLVISFCVGCHNALIYGTKIHISIKWRKDGHKRLFATYRALRARKITLCKEPGLSLL